MTVRCLVFLIWSVTTLVISGLAVADDSELLFEDKFERKLADGWSWLREEPDAWRIADGALEIRVQPGKAATVKNALVRRAPDRAKTDFAVEVTVTFTAKPIQQYEQGGITWYHDGKPVMKLVHEHVDGELWIFQGGKPAPSNTVRLRLEVRGRQWTSKYREDAKREFKTATSGELPPAGEDQISLQCYDGLPGAVHWIRFDDFRIVRLDD